MRILRFLMIAVLTAGLAACGGSKFKGYSGPAVTKVEVHKAARKMYLLGDGKVLRSYDIALGGNPVGHKQFEGDRKTPEGVYYIDRKNPQSRFHLSVGMSYPNQADRAFAQSQGKSPGGDIFIHGLPNIGKDRPRPKDWTDGCIAVTDKEIEEIYAMVQPGTLIAVFP